MGPHHQPLLHHHHLQMVVDPHSGPMINGVMMKTTMLIATMTVELVATMKPKDGIITAQIVHALRVVVPHNGPMICGVMIKTTMLIATLTMELVALMKTKDGI